MRRRSLLAASAATLPLLLATAGCRSSDLFAGPDPLGGRPPLPHDTVVLEAAITAEAGLISLYKSAISDIGHRGRGLTPLLAQHEEHLIQLRARLVVPAGASASESSSGSSSPSASVSAPAAGGRPAGPSAGSSAGSSGGPSAGAAGRDPVAGLRAAERESAATLVRRLATVQPALAQLLASIAASDATHVTALSSL